MFFFFFLHLSRRQFCPLIQHIISIIEKLVELLLSVVGSRKFILPDQTIKMTSTVTHGQMHKEDDEQTFRKSIQWTVLSHCLGTSRIYRWTVSIFHLI